MEEGSFLSLSPGLLRSALYSSQPACDAQVLPTLTRSQCPGIQLTHNLATFPIEDALLRESG
jgi:hypothetical protein